MRIDLHNHTTLCRHATGTIDDYITKAIEQDIAIYGFSCHAPMEFDPFFRMKLSEFPKYYEMVLKARQKYQDKIEILLGLEVDFIAGREDLLEKSILEAKLDYLIGSVHFLGDWGFDNPDFIGEYAKKDMAQCWKLYLNSITQMAQSGLFEIVGHFDLLKIFGYKPPEDLKPLINSTLQAIKDNQMVLEINAAGLRKPIKETYPDLEILKVVKKFEIPITFGSDAHSLDQVGFGYETCLHLAKTVGYKQAVFFKNKIPYFAPI